MVFNGNLAFPVPKAKVAKCKSMPHTSNKTWPALTLDTQWFTDPLPLPILTSEGFEVTGILG